MNVDGIGLGLMICKQLVEFNGGQISLISEGIDMGATVSFTFKATMEDSEQDELESEYEIDILCDKSLNNGQQIEKKQSLLGPYESQSSPHIELAKDDRTQLENDVEQSKQSSRQHQHLLLQQKANFSLSYAVQEFGQDADSLQFDYAVNHPDDEHSEIQLMQRGTEYRTEHNLESLTSERMALCPDSFIQDRRVEQNKSACSMVRRHAAKKPQILIVDQCPFNQEAIMNLLQEQGWTCDIYQEGVDNLSEFKNRSMIEQSHSQKLLINNL